MLDLIQKYLTEDREGVERIDKVLAIIGEAQCQRSFYAEASSEWSPDKRIEEGLGITIATWAEWGIEPILRIFIHALTDANFHDFAGVVQEKLDELESE